MSNRGTIINIDVRLTLRTARIDWVYLSLVLITRTGFCVS